MKQTKRYFCGLALGLLVSYAAAGSNSTDLTITGVVHASCGMNLTSSNMEFNFFGANAVAPQTTTLGLQCSAGVIGSNANVTAASSNAYAMVMNSGGNTYSIPYKLDIGNPSDPGWGHPVNTTLSSTAGTNPQPILAFSGGAWSGALSTLSLTVTPGLATADGSPSGTVLPSGNYGDTITFLMSF